MYPGAMGQHFQTAGQPPQAGFGPQAGGMPQGYPQGNAGFPMPPYAQPPRAAMPVGGMPPVGMTPAGMPPGGMPNVGPDGMMTLPNGQKISPEQAQMLAKAMLASMAGGGGGIPGMPGGEPPKDMNEMLQEALMPGGPQTFLMGGLAGCGSAYLFNQLFQDRTGGSLLERGARRLDHVPGVRQVSEFIDRQVMDRMRNGNAWAQQVVTHMDPAAVEKLHLEKIIQARQGKLPAAVYNRLMAQAGSAATLDVRVSRLLKTGRLAKNQPLDKAARRALNEILRGTRSMNNQFFGLYKDQHALMGKLGSDVGPIGRLYANSMLYLKRVMGGHTLHVSGGAAAAGKESVGLLGRAQGLLGKALGPFLAGGIIFGLSYGHAKKAEEGDKFKTFMHGLFGIGLGNFIGWEVGKRILRLTANTLAPALSNKLLLGRLARFVPLLGRVTLGGTLAELGAMLLLSHPFQKAGEKLAHLIFGKPRSVIEEENKKQGIYPAKALPSSDAPGQSGLNRASSGFDSFKKQRGVTPSATEAGHPDSAKGKAKAGATKSNTESGTYYPDEKFSMTPDEIAVNHAGEREQQYMDNVMSSLAHPSGFHNMFAPQLPVEGGHH